jgi:excisionase family DNA binding protein
MVSPAPQMRFLTVQEVADLMRVSTMTVYRMVHSGDMPAIRFGRSFRIPENAVSHLMGQLDEHRVDRAG